MDKDIPVLYVFVRTELNSMNPGKAQAHSGHAANAFVYKHYIHTQECYSDITEWMDSCNQGFGTQINLKAPWIQVLDAVAKAQAQGFKADFITDPTYPYEVDLEIAYLIDYKTHSQPWIDKGNGRVICFREEQTAAYIFGMKSKLESLVGMFPLHP